MVYHHPREDDELRGAPWRDRPRPALPQRPALPPAQPAVVQPVEYATYDDYPPAGQYPQEDGYPQDPYPQPVQYPTAPPVPPARSPHPSNLALPPPPRPSGPRPVQPPGPPAPPPRHFGGRGGGGGIVKRLFPIAAVILALVIVVPFLMNGVNGWKSMLGHLGIHVPSITNPVKTTTTDQVIGNVILEKVAGVSDPALGRADFNFDIERKVDKSFLLFKCWYAQDWHAEAHASANVNFSPGPNWWAKGSGHYVMTRVGRQVTVNLVLPRPTLPATVHQVVIDNTTSHALGAPMHSFSYPGPGCGPGVRNPHFSNEDFYPISQQIAFALVNGHPVKIDNVTMLNTATSADIRQRVTAAAEAEAHQLYMTTFIGPTVAGYGDHLAAVNIKWVPQSPN